MKMNMYNTILMMLKYHKLKQIEWFVCVNWKLLKSSRKQIKKCVL